MRVACGVVVVLGVVWIAACENDNQSTGGAGAGSGAGVGGQAGDATAAGGTGAGGAGNGGAGSGGAGGAGPCEGPCATQDVLVDFARGSSPLSRAFYGLTSPAQSSSGAWEIHIESHEGGDPGCPTMSSPTPKHTLVLSGLPAPLPATVHTEADGVAASLLDFDGALLDPSPITKATTVTVTPTASDVCIDCVGVSEDADGFVALDLAAAFPEGTVSGHMYATHCESLDLP